MEEHIFHSSANSDQFDPDDCITEPPSPIDGGITQPPIADEIMENNGVTQPPINNGPTEPAIDDSLMEDDGLTQPPIDGGPIEYGGTTQPPVDDVLREPLDHQFNEVQMSETPLQTEITGGRQSKLPQRKKRKETAGDSRGLPDQVQTSEPLLPTETIGYGQSKLTADQKYTKRLKEKWDDLERLVPGCSEIKFKADKLDKITSFLRSLKQQVQEANEQYKHLEEKYEQLSEYNNRLKEEIGMSKMEADKQNKHWKEKYEQLSEYNTTLKEQIEMSKMEADEQYKHLKEKYEQLNGEHTRLKEKMGLLGKLTQHQSVSLRQPAGETTPVNAASSTPEGPRGCVEISRVNAIEASGDASLQVQDSPHNNEREIASDLPSNKEDKHGTCGSANESDEAEFSSGGNEHKPSYLNGGSANESDEALFSISDEAEFNISSNESDDFEFSSSGSDGNEDKSSDQKSTSGDSSAMVLSSKKRKQSVEVREDLANGNILRLLEELVPDHIKVPSKGETKRFGSYNHLLPSWQEAEVDLTTTNRTLAERIKSLLSELVIKFLPDNVDMLYETIVCVESLLEVNEFLSKKLHASHPISKGDAAAADTDILKMLDADDESTVRLSDFSGLDGEHIKVGKYSSKR